ncbi:MAG: glycosyltransferase [Patescibacteria group bacterium]
MIKTVTIGIPAYNEEKNIKTLLESLLNQKQEGWDLDKIIIYSDASTDNTNSIVGEFTNKSLVLIKGAKRKGMCYGQKTISKITNSDFLVFINADVLPQDENLITNLIKNADDKTGVVGGKVVPAKAEGFMEKVYKFNHELKTAIYEDPKMSGSIYLCHGRIKCLTRQMYTKTRYEDVTAEDAFLYLECKRLGLKFVYAKNATVIFRSPTHLGDYFKQSSRFIAGKKDLYKYFDKIKVDKNYLIPKSILVKNILRGFIRNPILTSINAATFGLSNLKALSGKTSNNKILWDMSYSSKRLMLSNLESPKKLKLDVITKFFYPVNAGIEMNTLETYSLLNKREFDVTIHTTKDSLTKKNEFRESDNIKGLPIKRYKSGKVGFLPAIDLNKTDILCLHNFNIHPMVYYLFLSWVKKVIRRRNYKVILTPHGGFTPEWRVFPLHIKIPKLLIHRLIGNYLINNGADAIRAVSEWEKEEMIKAGVRKDLIEVISNGLENEAFEDIDHLASTKVREEVGSLGKYIIQVGRIFPIKNYQTTIKALKLLPEDLSFAILGPIGDDNYFQKLKDLTKTLGVEQRVKFLGEARGIDKYYLIKKSIAMVHMAIWESFCNVVHEAMSQGVICLVAKNTALPYLIKDKINGFCIPTRDSKKLADRINFILDSKNTFVVDKIKKTNLETARDHSWSNTSHKMGELYNDTFLGKRTHQGSFLFSFLFFLTVAVILASSVRGIHGNPSINDLNSKKWTDKGPLELSPERGRFALTYSLVEEKSFTFSVPVARFATPDLGFKNGKYVSIFAPGISALVIPGYLFGRYLGASQYGTFLIIAFFSLLNAVLIKKITRELGGGESASFIAALTYLFATPAFAYAVSLYQHHVSVFLILSSIYIILTKKSNWWLLVIWFLFTLSIPIDYPNLFLMLPIMLVAAERIIYIKKEEKKIKITFKTLASLTLISALIPVVMFLWYNKMTYGNPFQLAGTVSHIQAIDASGNPTLSSSSNSQQTLDLNRRRSALNFFKTRHELNGFYVFFLSKDRGLPYYTPISLLALIALPFFIKRNQKIGAVFFSIVAINILLYSMRGDVWGGWAFGARYLIPSYAILSIVLGVYLSGNRNKFVLLFVTCLFAYSSYVNTIGALTSNAIPPQVEVLALEKLSGREEKYTFHRSLDLLKANSSKSYIYNSYLKDKLSALEYFKIVLFSIYTLFTIVMLKQLFKKKDVYERLN